MQFFISLKTMQKAALLGLAMSLGFVSGATAQSSHYLVKAKALYQNKQYKEAAGLVRAGMYRGANNAQMWLLLADCYDKQGEAAAAKQAVDTLNKYFPGTPEAAQGLALLQKGGAASKVAGKAGAPDTAKEPPLIDRITVVPPQFGHTPVDSHTVTLIKYMVRMLPSNIYKIMDQGHVTIGITPNLIDRYPDAVQFKHPVLGHYLSEEYGRTYGKEIYICERLITTPGGTALQSKMDDETIKATAYTQFSHALDCCLEFPSRDKLFLTMYRQDLEKADHSNADLKPYISNDDLGTNEVFGGLAAGMMGNNTHITRMLETNFPRCKAWIKSRIDALAQ